MPATEYTAHLIADALAGGTSYQGPATVYLALVTTQPTRTVAGTEVTLGNYVRKTFAQSGWTNDGAGSLTNTADIEYPVTDEDYDDDVIAMEAYSLASGGNRLYWIDLATPRTVVTGSTPKFLAGDLDLSVV